LILQNDATFNDLDTDLKDSSDNNYNIITLQVYNDNNKFNVYVDNIINETTLSLKVPLRTEDCVYDSSSNKYQIFVYGQRVNNFKALDKNAIWTVTAAATQEIDRQQQTDKVRIAELETNVSSLQSEVSSLQSEVSSLQSEVSSLQSQLSNVLSRLSALENP
jgi:septal ring factor EnvC (AmiA/AmiB activator)